MIRSHLRHQKERRFSTIVKGIKCTSNGSRTVTEARCLSVAIVSIDVVKYVLAMNTRARREIDALPATGGLQLLDNITACWHGIMAWDLTFHDAMAWWSDRLTKIVDMVADVARAHSVFSWCGITCVLLTWTDRWQFIICWLGLTLVSPGSINKHRPMRLSYAGDIMPLLHRHACAESAI